MNSLVNHSQTAKTASSVNRQDSSALEEVLEISVKTKEQKLDLERLVEDSTNSLGSHSQTVKMASSVNQEDLSPFQVLEISV